MKYSKPIINIVLLFLLTAFSFSCDKGPVFEKYIKLKNSGWDRFDIKQFEIPVEEAAKTCNIELIVHCTEQFQYDNIPFYVIFTTSSGQELVREVTMPVRENGKLIKDLKGAKSESRIVLWKSINFPAKDKCKITVENMIPKIQIEGIDEIGIVVTKSK